MAAPREVSLDTANAERSYPAPNPMPAHARKTDVDVLSTTAAVRSIRIVNEV
jgi:hypothetical protein